MSNTKFQPLPIPLPFAVFDEFGKGADDRVQDYVAAAVAAEREYWAKIADELKLLLHSADARGLKLPVVQAKIVVWQHVSEPGYFSTNPTGALYDQMLENGWRPIYTTPPGILLTAWQEKMKAIADATFNRDWDTPLGPNVANDRRL